MQRKIPKVLYHYCGIETFYSIVVNKNLWLTDSYSTNDYMENRWINHKIDKSLPKYVTEESCQYLQQVLDTYNINDYIPFICCFSEDGDLLSQWRAYAKDGTGVAIGFNTEYFGIKHQLPFTMAVYNENSIGLHEVCYDDNIQLETLSKLFEHGLTTRQIPDVAIKLKQLSFIFKNSAFHEEREWRIIHTPLILGSHKDDTTQSMGAISDCKFRVTANDIAPYFVLPFSEKKEMSPIAEIVLGPKNKIAMYKLKTFLSMNELTNIPIRISDASYR